MEKMSKILVYVSIVLNGILLMVLFGIVPFLLYLSALVNIGAFWYIASMVAKNVEIISFPCIKKI